MHFVLFSSRSLLRYVVSCVVFIVFYFFFFNDPATTEIYTFPTRRSSDLRAHRNMPSFVFLHEPIKPHPDKPAHLRSEEHTSELQSRRDLVCRLLLEKKKKTKKTNKPHKKKKKKKERKKKKKTK